MKNIDNLYCAMIEVFLRKWFRKYSLNYDRYFEEGERLILEDMPTSNFEGLDNYDSSNDARFLMKAAQILGTDIQSIVEMDDAEVGKYYEKYAYFRILPDIAWTYNEQWANERNANPINQKSLINKILEYTQKYNQYIPGTFHRNASINNLRVETSIIASYDKAKEFWMSYLEMAETVQRYFFKILNDTDIPTEEINEYNFLVSTLDVIDPIIKEPLYYQLIVDLKEVYLEEEYEDFFSYANINLGLDTEHIIHPWCFIETAQDKDIIQRYINIHPVINGKQSKEYLRKFVLDVKNYNCCFEWSDAKEFDDYFGGTIKEKTEIYISKEQEEIQKYEKACNNLDVLSGPPISGGVSQPKRELPYQHYFCFNSSSARKRMKKRLDVLGETK